MDPEGLGLDRAPRLTVSTVLSIVVGILIPALTAVVTRVGLNAKLKALVLLALSTISAALVTVTTNPPHSWTQWQHFLLNLGLTYLAAAASLIATWKLPVAHRAEERIYAVTDPHFGLGPAPDTPPPSH